MDKVAIYCRLSKEDRNKTNEKDDSMSIQNQKQMLEEYAYKQGWFIYKVYTDDDYSGTERNRPAFNEMITDVLNKKANIVLCKTQSRFTRELEIVEKYIHNIFPQNGIRFVSVVDNIDTQINGNKKARQINGLINEWYLEDMSDSIKAALKSRMKSGYFIGSMPPYGYKKDPNKNGHLIVDEEVAPVVKRIFLMYMSGIGKTAIARQLNQEKILSPCAYYFEKGIKKKDGNLKNPIWRYSTVSHILCNEMYIGNLVQGTTHNPTYKSKHSVPTPKEDWIIIENTHEPIIDKEVWDIVRRLWSERSKPCWVKNQALEKQNCFHHKLFCNYCKSSLTTSYNLKKGNKKRYYRCPTRLLSKDLCCGVTVFEDTIKESLLQEIKKLSEQYLELDCLSINNLTDDFQKELSLYESQLKNNRNELDKIKLCIKNLYIDKTQNIISNMQYQMLSEDFENQITSLTNSIKEIELKISQLHNKNKDLSNKKETIKKLSQIKEITPEFVNIFIKSIFVGGTKNDREIIINWNF